MTKNSFRSDRVAAACCVAGLLFVTTTSCSRPTAVSPSGLKRMPPGQEFAGFLSTYANLKPDPNLEDTKSYVCKDPAKNVHRYVAMIVDSPVVYASTSAPDSAIPERGVAALKEYFQDAITNAVDDAFPIIQSSGPLVLRLRSAIVGIDVGQPVPAGQTRGDMLERPLNIGKVGVEMELVDSETGEQIAAAVDRDNLGEGAVIGSASFTHEEKFRAATQAFDGWAARLRQFLDSAHELSEEDIEHVEQTNFPYASEDTPVR